MSESIYTNNGTAPEAPGFTAAPHHAGHNELRMYLARQNVARKRNLVKNIIAYALAWIICFGLMHATFVSMHHVYSTNVANAEPAAHEISQSFWVHPNGFSFSPGTFENVFEAHIIENALELPIRTWRYPIRFAGNIVWGLQESAASSISFQVAQSDTAHPVATVPNNNSFTFFLVGIMFAWGIWILARGVQVARHSMRCRPKKISRPDPVALEYQRLSDMEN